MFRRITVLVSATAGIAAVVALAPAAQVSAGAKTTQVGHGAAQSFVTIVCSMREQQAASAFHPVATEHAGPRSIIQGFWSPGTTNLLLLSDSIGSYSHSADKLSGAILRAWNHPAGWDGLMMSSASNSLLKRLT